MNGGVSDGYVYVERTCGTEQSEGVKGRRHRAQAKVGDAKAAGAEVDGSQ